MPSGEWGERRGAGEEAGGPDARGWGNSLGLRVPKDIAERLRLTEGSRVELEADAAGRIIMTPARRRYTLDELLAQCDPQALVSEEDRAWLDAPRVGGELL